MAQARTILAIALALFATTTAQAQDYPILDDPWRIYLGAFDATVDSTLEIRGENLPPRPPIDVEDILGVAESKTVFWGGVGWRFARRHNLEFEGFALNRSAAVTEDFDPPLQAGDTYLESGTVSTSYDTSVYRLTYGFSAVRGERSDLQLKAGIHIASMEAGLGLSGAICDPTTTPTEPPGCPPLGASVETEDVTAPLPHIGISYAYALSPKWAFNIAGLAFAVEIDDIDGSITEVNADFAWQPMRHFGVGLGYRYFTVNVESGGSQLNGEFEFDYHGPALYIQATF
jgi:hypothetical protein